MTEFDGFEISISDATDETKICQDNFSFDRKCRKAPKPQKLFIKLVYWV